MIRLAPIQFGHEWLERDGRRGAVVWYPATGQLVYEAAGRNRYLLAVITEEPVVRVRLLGWERHGDEGVDWVRNRVAPWACMTCHGEGWVGTNFFHDEEVAVPCPLCNPADL